MFVSYINNPFIIFPLSATITATYSGQFFFRENKEGSWLERENKNTFCEKNIIILYINLPI